MTIEVDISVECDRWSEAGDLSNIVQNAITAAHQEASVELASTVEVSLLFCDDERMRELNREWRGLDKPTNVLSFPAVEPSDLAHAPLLGDIAVAFETVKRESADENKSLRDHLSHMIVHGFLHLVGYDHEVEDEAEEMEDAERRALARLGVADPYAATVPARGVQR